jgi:hypothetical protein
VGGGVQLAIVAPDSALAAGTLARTPFSSWVVPGVLLIATVAVPAAVVAVGAAAGRSYSHAGHPLVGLVLVGWIAIQLLVIGPVSALQALMFGLGVTIFALGGAHLADWQNHESGDTPVTPRQLDRLPTTDIKVRASGGRRAG